MEETSPTLEISKTFIASSIRVEKLKDVKKHTLVRMQTGFAEIDRVLGGGVVPAEVMLISGEPGIGKSTLLLQLLANQEKAAYVSAEESIEQVAMRGQRIISKKMGDLNIISSFEIGTILNKLEELKPKFVVIDSIQTVYSSETRGLPGGIAQIKSVASKLVNYAKENGIIMFIVGQITKEGSFAGPKLLEHLVDVVMQLEGDEKFDYRILRCSKNRYGPTDEVGVFEMNQRGMEEVKNPALYFLDEKTTKRMGVCPGIVLEGNRLMIVEMQALTVKTYFAMPKRVSEGVNKSRLELITAIINKYTKFNLNDSDVFISIAGGLRVQDPLLDIPIALALISSLKEVPISNNLVAFGELSLTGQIRHSKRKDSLEKEIKRLGYQSYLQKYPSLTHISQIGQIFEKITKR
jgi:DNA repair protein RadA/Sms